MRNWNSLFLSGSYQRKTTFLAYLWGIETMTTARSLRHAARVFSLPMRNWNCRQGEFMQGRIEVFSLPMRNWNTSQCFSHAIVSSFLAYLWGIETFCYIAQIDKEDDVFSLPMRNWNLSRDYARPRPKPVFSLPMRNWNSVMMRWTCSGGKVFSLPMRNWNFFLHPQTPIYRRFLAYLWGIETR